MTKDLGMDVDERTASAQVRVPRSDLSNSVPPLGALRVECPARSHAIVSRV
jgi:hypothetical protein